MRTSLVSARLSFVAFYCTYLLARANCEEQSIQDGNPKHASSNLADSLVHERAITLGKEPVARGTTFDKFPTFDRKNFRQGWLKLFQRPSREVALKHQQVGRSRANKPAIFTGKLPPTILARPEMTDSVGNGELSVRTPSRRSTGTSRRKEGGTLRDSRFPRGDRHSRARQVDVDTSRSIPKGSSKNSEASPDGERLVNLLDLLPFKNGHSEIVSLPGQPVRRILAFIFDRIKRRPDVEVGRWIDRLKDALNRWN